MESSTLDRMEQRQFEDAWRYFMDDRHYIEALASRLTSSDALRQAEEEHSHSRGLVLKVRAIEVVWNGRLEKLLFVPAQLTLNLSQQERTEFFSNLNHLSSTRHFDFIKTCHELYRRMKVESDLTIGTWASIHVPIVNVNVPLYKLLFENKSLINMGARILYLLINLLMLFCLRLEYIEGNTNMGVEIFPANYSTNGTNGTIDLGHRRLAPGGSASSKAAGGGGSSGSGSGSALQGGPGSANSTEGLILSLGVESASSGSDTMQQCMLALGAMQWVLTALTLIVHMRISYNLAETSYASELDRYKRENEVSSANDGTAGADGGGWFWSICSGRSGRRRGQRDQRTRKKDHLIKSLTEATGVKQLSAGVKQVSKGVKKAAGGAVAAAARQATQRDRSCCKQLLNYTIAGRRWGIRWYHDYHEYIVACSELLWWLTLLAMGTVTIIGPAIGYNVANALFFGFSVEYEAWGTYTIPGVCVWVLVFLGPKALYQSCKVFCKRNHYDQFGAFFFVCLADAACRDSNFTHVFLLGCSTLGLFSRPMFCLNMLELLFVKEELKPVLNAIGSSARTLCWTILLLLACVWIFAVVGFVLMGHLFDVQTREVDKIPVFMVDWFFYLLSQLLVAASSEVNTCKIHNPISSALLGVLWRPYLGLDANGTGYPHPVGMMEPDADCEMKTTEHETQLLKMLFELAFSVIMVIVLLQMVFGIIIDTFGQLREEQTAVVEQRRNYCFLCGIDKRRFELEAVQASKKDGGGWIEHIRNEHNVWDYFFYYCYLQEKTKLDYSGVDTYVNSCLQNGDLDWLPVSKSISLQEDENVQPVQKQLDDLRKQVRSLANEETTRRQTAAEQQNQLLEEMRRAAEAQRQQIMLLTQSLQQATSTGMGMGTSMGTDVPAVTEAPQPVAPSQPQQAMTPPAPPHEMGAAGTSTGGPPSS
eukprot:g1935.t1